MPKTPFRNVVTDLTRLSGQEYVGLCLLVMVALHGAFVSLAKSGSPKERKKWEGVEDDFILLLMLTLSLDTLLINKNHKKEENRNVHGILHSQRGWAKRAVITKVVVDNCHYLRTI